ncbi:sodium:solute symporter family protein [Sporomusa sphaeroides]|uniref:sodium:solute symporter family protein n=1 Tax=Sporomusa sphaeroides TaxID=47679 RepID=UPI00203077A2|nr:sodium:solute symporter family protein [Sporomusa sphaeroides]MCM0759287.1 sodium:solute symporter family protein [Sporomusa sphaeroides DSM 2875]HML35342.1 sodium:solute symporter family protein [Sporomusa sphaeroides]
MSNEVIALIVIFIFVIGATIVGMIPGMNKKMSLEEWAVGNRSFGRWLNWFIMAGEIYTAFAFLGASGWAYARGGPTFYILGYGALAYVVGYYLLPAIATVGRKHGLMTQPDLVEKLYSSKALGILTACIGIAFLMPYLQLQLTGLGLIIETCSYGQITRVPAMLIAFTMVATFVYISGLKGVAATAAIKDVVMMVAVVFFGLYLPAHYFGSVGGMFEALDAAKPGFLTLPGGTKNLDVSWVMSTLVVTSLGFYMWPHFSANSFSAKNNEVLRHNAVYLPLYQFCLLFPMLIGFTALLVLVPALKTPDMAFMAIVQQVFPGWALGLVGGAGALACMIPAADLLLSTSMLFSRNVYGRTIGQNASPATIGRLARMVVLVLTAIALALAIFVPNMLVNLLLTGYSGVTQFFPMLVLGLCWKKATKLGAYAGLIVGEIFVFALILGKMDPLPFANLNLNAGFVALVANAAVFVVVSLLTYDAKLERSAATAVNPNNFQV